MRLVLDTCVIFPTVMREMLLGAAEAGFYTPIWSDRILEEWRRAAQRLGPVQAAVAEGEIALLRAHWTASLIAPAPGLEARLWLPDAADIHVLAVAVARSADGIVTMNAKDFPRHLLAEEGLSRSDPDALLHEFWQARPEAMQAVGQTVLDRANAAGEGGWEIRPLLKKARLPRLAKALSM